MQAQAEALVRALPGVTDVRHHDDRAGALGERAGEGRVARCRA